MMRIVVLFAVALCAMTTATDAAEALPGWSVTYNKDAFTGAVLPTAWAAEANAQITPARLFYECSKGHPAFSFSPGVPTFVPTSSVDFKGEDGTIKSIAFPEDTKPADTAALRRLLTGAKQEVAFRTSDGSQGTFAVVGAAEVFAVVEAACK